MGVEFSQLLFIEGGMLLFFVITKLPHSQRLESLTKNAMVYAIGGLAVFWMLERGLPVLRL